MDKNKKRELYSFEVEIEEEENQRGIKGSN